jgi:hypothetical protein
MTPDDIARTLYELDCVYKDANNVYCIRYHKIAYQSEVERLDSKGYKVPIKENLRWSPFLFKRADSFSNFN